MERGSLAIKDVSYLRARDPSILAWNSNQFDIKDARMNLLPQWGESTASGSDLVSNTVKV